jgi:tRNA G46 methylase TrmB
MTESNDFDSIPENAEEDELFLLGLALHLDDATNPEHCNEDDVNASAAAAAAAAAKVTIPRQQQQPQYMSRKPLWWKRKSGNTTKGQRRALNDPAMQRFKLLHNKPAVYGEKFQWNQVFNNTANERNKEIWLELGFGLGDNLLCLAARSRSTAVSDQYFVGAEVHAAGVGAVLSRMQSGIQQPQHYWDGYTLFDESTRICYTAPRACNDVDCNTTTLYDHVRIYAGDGTKLMHRIPDQSVDTVLVAFPDPFPRDQEQPWRLLQLEVLTELRRIVTGRVYLATDHEGYHKWSHQQVETFNRHRQMQASSPTDPAAAVFALVAPTPDRSTWLPVVSKYEQKAWDEGRTTHLSCWEAR